MKTLLPIVLGIAAAGLPAAAQDAGTTVKTPAQRAAEALDAFRDDTHKEREKIVWPADPEDPPAVAEVYLIHGYIDFACTRLTWKDGALRAERVRMGRTWFYNPKGEGFQAERFDVPAAAFLDAWRAVSLLLRAEAVPPLPTPIRTFDGDGNLVSMRFPGSSHTVSSHEPHVWVRLRGAPGQPPRYERTARGMKRVDDIQVFDDLRLRALHRVFAGLLPEGKDAPPGRSFPLVEWAPILADEVRDALEQVPDNLTNLDKHRPIDLLLETSLRILGETGHEPAGPVVEAVRARLADATEKDSYRAWSIRLEADRASAKIHFLTRWDAAEAMDRIHGDPRLHHADNDLARWLRTRYFERDPEGYRAQLVSDLAARAKEVGLLRETIAELVERYPGHALSEIRGLLGHVNPEVAADAAFALLKHQPDDAEATARLDRIAGDPAAGIPPDAEWFRRFARQRALDHLRSKQAPDAARWNAGRVRRQLARPDEDGRMIHALLSALDILYAPATESEKIEAYRRALAGARNKGILTACEELIALKDRDSAGAIRAVLDELAAGCNKELSWKPDPTARFPWVDRYQLDRIRKSLEEMGAPEPKHAPSK